MQKRIIITLFFVLLCVTGAYAQEMPPVAQQIMENRAEIEMYKASLPPVARHILFSEERNVSFEQEGKETPVLKESNWDDLPVMEEPKDDITDFFLQFQTEDDVPEIISPFDGTMLPDNTDINIRIKYDGKEPCFAEINSTSSSSVIEIKNKHLIILSKKLVRGREYHLRVRAGNAYSETVSFRVGNKYEDEIARIVANSDVVAVKPRISMNRLFPNGFFHSEEEAEANMRTITVKVWRANTETVEVEEEEVVDEIVKTIRVPVVKTSGADKIFATKDTMYNMSVEPEAEETTTQMPEAEVLAENEETTEAEVEQPKQEQPAEAETEQTTQTVETVENQQPAEETTLEQIAATEEQIENTTAKPELVIEGYTEITTIEYVTKTVKRTVNQGELYSSTMRITVNRGLADEFTAIFNELYELKFPIESVGCFNWRDTASGRVSEHSLGTAIDINPEQNYCVYGDGSTVGEYWRPYEDIYSITPEVVNVFRRYNFSWGGSWITPKDYMHFSYYGT